MDITLYEFPAEIEPYRSMLIGVHTGEKVEDVLNAYYNNLNATFDLVLRASSLVMQINLLKDLHHKRMLRDLKGWVCKTPYPNTSKFCGKPGEHPDFWGCGYKAVD